MADKSETRSGQSSVIPALILRTHGNEDGDEEYIIVDHTPFRVGRRPDNDAQIPRPDVSGLHAEFRYEESRWSLHDNKSTNGTFINGKRMSEPLALKLGDIIHFATMGYVIVPKMERQGEMVATTVLADSADIQGMVDLLKIVNEQRTFPYFQPIIDLTSKAIVGWEALGRGATTNGPISPGVLFRLASQSRIESKLSMRFRESARFCVECRHCWHSQNGTQLWVNLHPAEIHDEKFLSSLQEFSQSDSESARWYQIVVEMPESWVCHTDEMQGLVKQIRDLGMLVAYDDYGAGQSRLAELITIPPDYLKLDRQLIASIGSNKVKRNLVKAFVDACNDLNVTTLGEGIETEDELASCMGMGIQLGQGYFLGRPGPALELFRTERRTLPAHCPFVKLDLLPK